MLQLIQSGGLTFACIIAKASKGSNVCGEKVAVAVGEQAYLWRAEGASVKQAEKALSSVGRSVSDRSHRRANTLLCAILILAARSGGAELDTSSCSLILCHAERSIIFP